MAADIAPSLVDDPHICKESASRRRRAVDNRDSDHGAHEDEVEYDAREGEEGDAGGAAGRDCVE